MTDLPSTGPKGHHQAHMPFALTHRHSDSTSFDSKRSRFVSDHSMDSEAVLRPDCRICLEVDDGVRKALHKEEARNLGTTAKRMFAE